MLTSNGLVNHAKTALSEKWGYVWGTFGHVLTQNILRDKLAQYPDGVGKYEEFIRSNWLNKRTVDCIGLIKSYMWWVTNGPVYNSKTDVSADGMFALAVEKGRLEDMPETPGLCLWKPGHIGIYIGNGQVIEARGTKYGVIKSPLTGEGSASWLKWLECPFVEYPPKRKNYIEIIKEYSDGSAEEWIKGIETAVSAAKSDGNLGSLEIFQYLPLLIEKIGNK
jgi:hypothetical protein